MLSKVFVLLAAVTIIGVHSLPVEVVSVKTEEYDAHPQYSYSYGVNDPVTGDNKEQHESRDGDVVTGQYSLVEPDGTRRTVDYTADSVNGFNAVVSKSGEAHVVKSVAHAPTLHVSHAPVAYHSPTVTYHHAAPTVTVAHAPALAYYSQPTTLVHHQPLQLHHEVHEVHELHHQPLLTHTLYRR